MNAKIETASSCSPFNPALNNVFHIASGYSTAVSLRLKHEELSSYLVIAFQEKHSFF